MANSFTARNAKDDADDATAWWSDYPTRQFVDRARAQDTFDSLVTGVWNKPRRLARSASYTNLTYVKEAQHDFPIKRSPSVSSLAPSLALPQYYREAPRIVHTTRVYKPHVYDWSRSYARARFEDTLRETSRPYKRAYVEPTWQSSHVPFYTFQTKRIFFDQKLAANKSYLRGSQKYLDKYVASRLKADDFAAHYAYSAYEWRKPQDHAFNRHLMWDNRVSVIHAPGNPVNFYEQQALRRLYKITGRFYF